MQYVSELSEFAEFFGTEPKIEYPHLPYLENVTTLEADLDFHNIWLQYMPSQAWAELRIAGKPFSMVKLLLSDIESMSIRKTQEDHTLEVKFSRKLTSNLSLSLRPRVMLFWGNQGAESDTTALSPVSPDGDA
jgi:hypothetical protein